MECFCGCGRRIWLIQRLPNSYGKTAALLVGKLEALDMEDDEDVALMLQVGRQWFDDYAAATHGELPLKTLSTEDWKRWRNMAFGMVKEAESSHDKLGRWLLAEGLTPTEGAEKVAAMSPEEQLAFRRELELPVDD
jgi:hypothetical protein